MSKLTVKVVEELILQKAVPKLQTIKFDRFDDRQRILILLYSTLLEIAHSACILLRNNHGHQANILIRTLLETTISLVNVAKHDKYHYTIMLEEEIYWQKLIDQAEKGNPFLESVKNAHHEDPQIDSTRSRRNKHFAKEAELRSAGAKELKIYEKFRLADEESLYRSAYSMMSGYSHSSLRSLQARHMKSVGDDIVFVAFTEHGPDDFELVLDAAFNQTLLASRLVHNFFGTGEDSCFN